MTEQQKMVALLKMGKPVMKDAIVGSNGSPSPSSHDLTVGDNLLGGGIDYASSEMVAEGIASAQAISQLNVSQQHGSAPAHDSAEGAVAMLPGLPSNLEGISFTAPGESSPEDTGPQDTDAVEKSFVTTYLTAPSRTSYKNARIAFNLYKNDIGKKDFEEFFRKQ